jgi:hypothetical protein
MPSERGGLPMSNNTKLKVAERTAQIKRWAMSNIESYAQYLKTETEKLQRAEETAEAEVAEWQESLEKLRAAGFRPKVSKHTLDIVLDTKMSRLTEVAKAIGRLDPKSLDKDIADAKKKLVKVSIRGARFSKVKVVFVRKLLPTDKCQIEEVKVPETVEYRLVCKNGG